MAALATQDDVVAELGRALTSDEQTKVEAALESASDFVRTETGRRFEAGTFTVTRHSRGKVRLDSASAVSAVTLINSDGSTSSIDPTSYTLRKSVLYGLSLPGQYEVTYTSDGTVPAELVRVVAAMAARDITDERPQGATSYTVTKGPFTESASYDEPTDSVMPTASEARVIRRFSPGRTRSVSLI